jgi:hypothetical protein
MLSDTRAQFCAATALNTGGAGSYLIGDTIDLSDIASDLGPGGRDLFLVVSMATNATSGGSATAQFALVTDAADSFGSPAVIAVSDVLPVASMVAGSYAWVLQVPHRGAYERYLRLRQTTGTAAFNGGTINAFFTTNVPSGRVYNNGVTS